MNFNSNAKAAAVRFIDKHTESVLLFLGLGGLLLGLGFLFGDVEPSDYSTLTRMFSKSVWAGLFLAYGLYKLFSIGNTSYYVDIFVSAVGTWLWSYMGLSFFVFDPSPMYPVEPLLLLPIFSELWTLSVTIFRRRNYDAGW